MTTLTDATRANARIIYDRLVRAGMTPPAVIGVLGNLFVESGLDTRAVGDSGLAHGLAQWHPSRWTGLLHMAAAHGLNPYSVNAQVSWLIEEGKTSDGGHAFSLLIAHDRVWTIEEAAAVWMRLYERPADQSNAAAHRRAVAGIEVHAHMPPKPTSTPPPPAHGTTYRVAPGDTLTSIAHAARVSLDELRRLNPGLFDHDHHGGNLIRPGEHVRLP